MTWQLRRAGAADVPAIMAIETAMFPTDAWSPEAMARDVSDPNCYYLVAFPPEAPQNIEAYAGLLAPRGAFEADIQTIAVADVSRGRGRGRSLLRTLLDEAARREVAHVFLEVRADNPVAQALYASEGFAEIGRKPRYYQPDDVDAVVMKLDVRGWRGASTGSASDADDSSGTAWDGGVCT